LHPLLDSLKITIRILRVSFVILLIIFFMGGETSANTEDVKCDAIETDVGVEPICYDLTCYTFSIGGE